MQCRVGDDDLQEDWMPVRQGNELAKVVVLGCVVKDEVSANVRSNCDVNSNELQTARERQNLLTVK